MSWQDEEGHRNYHRAANLFPLLSREELECLKADIEKNGLIEPIYLHPNGSILDGRNRHCACIETGTKPRFETWSSKGSPIQFVVSKNLHRRHLTSSQRAAISLEALEMLEEEARERMKAGGEATTKQGSQRIDTPDKGRASDHAAEIFKTNRQYVSDAKKLRDEAPDLLNEVKTGEKSIPQARRELVKRKREALPRPEPPQGKYSVIYADPPWSYDNSGFNQSAEQQYPTMSQAEICALPVGELAFDECVLFLWATSPLLPEAFDAMRAWGFEYKASRVWVKDRSPGMGWFLKTRHEFLLIGVRGRGHPIERLDSIIEAPVTRHSEKPASVYEDIERCYEGPYIELFARNIRTGWEVWGNEIQG